MTDLKWWQQAIVYQVYPKSFCDSSGDGIGDLSGITKKLDYLQKLDIGALWLCPVYPSPQADNGYDITDYCDIDPQYGTMADMENLIHEAGRRGIKIIMDLVFNHTSDQHPWFEESKSSKENSKRDWYIWRDGKDGKPPTNWRSIFGGSAWTLDETTGQYYLHTFSPQQPDLNWENPQVRRALYDVTNFWLRKGIGGFRIDAIPYVKKPAVFENLPADGPDGLGDIAKATACQDGILAFLREWKQETFGRDDDVFTVAEAAEVHPQDYVKWIGKDGVFDMVFEFSHIRLGFEDGYIWHKRKNWKLIDIRKCLTADEKAVKDKAWLALFFENHDLPRSVNYFFPSGTDTKLAAKFLASLLLTLRGTPFIYEGEELGMTNIKWPSIKMYDDIYSVSEYELALKDGLTPRQAMEGVWKYSRDNARSPMAWNRNSHAGFTTGRPWLPLNDEYGEVNVDTELQDENSVLNFYIKLIKLRRSSKALLGGDYEELLSYSPGIYAYARSDEQSGERIIVIANTTAKIRGYKLPELKGSQLLLSNYNDRESSLLRSYEVRIYKVK